MSNLNIKEFILPKDKMMWETCAKVLYNRRWQEMLPYTRELLEWLQDSNWPGFKIIVKKFAEIDYDMYLSNLREAVNQAIINKDEVWALGLHKLIQDANLVKLFEENDLNSIQLLLEL